VLLERPSAQCALPYVRCGVPRGAFFGSPSALHGVSCVPLGGQSAGIAAPSDDSRVLHDAWPVLLASFYGACFLLDYDVSVLQLTYVIATKNGIDWGGDYPQQTGQIIRRKRRWLSIATFPRISSTCEQVGITTPAFQTHCLLPSYQYVL
jgi:hypothetical protein